jgi:hypothetical protein
MLINELNNNNRTTSVKRKKLNNSSDKASFDSALSGLDASIEASSVATSPAGNISNIQSLISLDALGILSQLGNEEFVKKQNIDWGKAILNELESIKHQILNGKISYTSLLSLKERLNNIPINSNDTKLKGIIEQIVIRAEVEIAKLNKLSKETKFFNN